MRLVTLNMWHNPWMWQQRAAFAAEQLTAEQADIVCLQEVRFDGGLDSASIVAGIAGYRHVVTKPIDRQADGSWSGTAVLSRTPLSPADIQLPVFDSPAGHCTLVRTEISGVATTIASVHFAWGGHNEAHRLAQARHLDSFLRAHVPETDVCVIAGDFNCEPDSDTMRFLTGKAAVDGTSTFWVDTWETARGQRQPHDAPSDWGATVTTGNIWAFQTALSRNLNPDLVPPRRIDFVLVRGWAYGITGGVAGTNLVLDDDVALDGGEGPVSDHCGLRVDLSWGS